MLSGPPKKPPTFLDRTGFYKCRRCKACKTVRDKTKTATSFPSVVTGGEYDIRQFITCDTRYVTYLLMCPCNFQYVGRTTRTLAKRVGEHIDNIKKGFKHHSVSNHFRLMHKDPSLLRFWGIDRVRQHWRGTDMTKKVSQIETQWIYRIQFLQPMGLNIDIDLKCFVTDY